MKQVLEAVKFMHDKGVVHRDLKVRSAFNQRCYLQQQCFSILAFSWLPQYVPILPVFSSVSAVSKVIGGCHGASLQWISWTCTKIALLSVRNLSCSFALWNLLRGKGTVLHEAAIHTINILYHFICHSLVTSSIPCSRKIFCTTIRAKTRKSWSATSACPSWRTRAPWQRRAAHPDTWVSCCVPSLRQNLPVDRFSLAQIQ